MSNLSAGDLATLLREQTELIEQLNVKGDPLCPDCGKVTICPHCNVSDLVCNECGHVHCPECGDELLCPDCNEDLVEGNSSEELLQALGEWIKAVPKSMAEAAAQRALRLEWDRYQAGLEDSAPSEWQPPCKKLEMTIEPTGDHTCTGKDCNCDCGKGHSASCGIGKLLVRARAAETALEQACIGEMINGPGLSHRQATRGDQSAILDEGRFKGGRRRVRSAQQG
jgi:hypothetical protein